MPEARSVAGAFVLCLFACESSDELVSRATWTPSPAQIDECATTTNAEWPELPDYWPPTAFEDPDGFLTSWYQTQLCAMGEPSLTASRDEVHLRFLWLRTFQPGIAVRIAHGVDRTDLFARQLSGAGGYAPGHLERSVDHTISEDEWRQVLTSLSDIDYWSLPSTNSDRGLDGSEWVIEVVENDRHKVVSRWGGGEIEALGHYLLGLSELNPDPIY